MKRIISLAMLCALLHFFPIHSWAAAGGVDKSFGTDGSVEISFGTGDGAQALAIQPDGKIVVAGYAVIGTQTKFALARMNSDGALDSTFGTAGKVLITLGVTDFAMAVALQADGKIIVAGYSSKGLQYTFAVARLNKDGSLDASFGIDGKATVVFGASDDRAFGLALQPDGKIVLVGYTYGYEYPGGSKDYAVARLNSNGILDPTFDVDGKWLKNLGGEDEAQAVAVQTDGKIVFVGISDVGSTQAQVLRINGNGSYDPGFNAGALAAPINFGVGGRYDGAQAVLLQPDGKMVVAGYSDLNSFGVARLNTDGTQDTSFAGGLGALPISFGVGGATAYAAALQLDGKIVLGGFYEKKSFSQKLESR